MCATYIFAIFKLFISLACRKGYFERWVVSFLLILVEQDCFLAQIVTQRWRIDRSSLPRYVLVPVLYRNNKYWTCFVFIFLLNFNSTCRSENVTKWYLTWCYVSFVAESIGKVSFNIIGKGSHSCLSLQLFEARILQVLKYFWIHYNSMCTLCFEKRQHCTR